MRSAIILIYLIVFLLTSTLRLIRYFLIGMISTSQKQYEYASKIAHEWASMMLRLAGTKVTIHGKDHIPMDQTVLFVSNHQGNFDIPIILANIQKPMGFIAKIELKKIPIMGTWIKAIGSVFIDRKDMRQSLRTINEGIGLLKTGHSMVIFPEGTRSKGDELGSFKQGSLRLASKAKVPVVPLAISGSYKIMEQHGLNIKSANVQLLIGEPIYLDQLSEELQKDSSKYVQEKIQELLNSKNVKAASSI